MKEVAPAVGRLIVATINRFASKLAIEQGAYGPMRDDGNGSSSLVQGNQPFDSFNYSRLRIDRSFPASNRDVGAGEELISNRFKFAGR